MTVVGGGDERKPWKALTPTVSGGASTGMKHNLAASAGFDNLHKRMTGPIDPDAALMIRVKQGDREAFAQLVDKYKQPVMNLVFRTLSDATEAEDVAQQVFVQVFKSAARYEISARFSTWIFTIARNLCLNEIRRRTRHPAESIDRFVVEDQDLSPRQLSDSKAVAPPDHLLHSELVAKVEEAIVDLPGNQKTAILLCRREDMSYEQIAHVLGVSVSATKSLIHRARETLKARLKPYLRSGHWVTPASDSVKPDPKLSCAGGVKAKELS